MIRKLKKTQIRDTQKPKVFEFIKNYALPPLPDPFLGLPRKDSIIVLIKWQDNRHPPLLNSDLRTPPLSLSFIIKSNSRAYRNM